MPAKPKPKPDDPEQSARFVEAAKRAEVDESGDAFDKAVTKLLQPKEPPDTSGKPRH